MAGRGEASTVAEQVLAAVGRVVGSILRHSSLGQVLCDTFHLQADLVHPAASKSAWRSHEMEWEPRLVKAWLPALVSGRAGIWPQPRLDHRIRQEPAIRKKWLKLSLQTCTHFGPEVP